MHLRVSHKSFHKSAFELAFHTHFESLCRFAVGYVNDRDSAQEIVQDVFINLWEKRETIDPGKPVKSYLFTSVRNRCLNFIRDHKKFRSYYLDVELEMEVKWEDNDNLSEADTERRVSEALNKLPEKCREVFELSRFDELKYKEIAEKLGISVKTVEVQMSKALKVMRGELKDLLIVLILMLLK